MSIIIVRHGNTEYNTARVFQPHHATLSELGLQQAKLCGERLKSYKIVKILTSDLMRTKQTTQEILAARNGNVEVIESELLREREFGDLKGKSYDHIQGKWYHPNSDYKPPNGENWSMFHDRIKTAWNWILEHARDSIKSPEEAIVVVTHGLVKTSLASKIWNSGNSKIPSFENTSVSIVSIDHPHDVQELNSTTHLDNLSSKL